jgi:PKD repeat protein
MARHVVDLHAPTGVHPRRTGGGLRRRRPCWALTLLLVVASSLLAAVPAPAEAAVSDCGTSGSVTLCISASSSPLSSEVPITVTSSPNRGRVTVTWTPTGEAAETLITKRGPSPSTNDYSFVWPTHKHLDAGGVLRVKPLASDEPVASISVQLANGNRDDYQRNPSDWERFLPAPEWTASRDPVVAAVGDGASDEPLPNALARSVVDADPDLFLYLGDIYEDGTHTEMLNHYGRDSWDGGPGTLMGALAHLTQPTIGNHEIGQLDAWTDYFRGRPLYHAFRMGNVLFFNLASDGASMRPGSEQYEFVRGILEDPDDPPPPCIVTYFHRPVLSGGSISTSRLGMWELLTNNGGDLVFVGHSHSSRHYKPLNAAMELPTPGEPTMVQLISGAGGTGLGSSTDPDPRIDWQLSGVAAASYLTLHGARNGGTPTSLSWTHRDTAGNMLYQGSRDCGGTASPTPPPALEGFSPSSGATGTLVTVTGTDLAGALAVHFNGVSAPYSVEGETRLTATVPTGATTGPISVTTPGGIATSGADFIVSTAPDPGTAPVAAFTTSTTEGPAPLTVAFTDTSTGDPTSWAWDFGDGTTATDRHPTHTYTQPGTYTATLTATNTHGTSQPATATITVTPPPDPGGDTTTVLATDDAYIVSSKPNGTNGTQKFMRLGGGATEYRPYLGFDVTGLTGTITRATLRIQVTVGSDHGGNWHRVGNDWTETTLTWSNAPALDGLPIAVLGRINAGDWIELDVTDQITSNGRYSFAASSSSTNNARFATREAGTPAQLVITTTGP